MLPHLSFPPSLSSLLSLPLVRLAATVCAGLVAAVILARVLVWAVRAWRRHRVATWLRVPVPRKFRVRRAPEHREVGAFLLHYPTWRYAKKDRTRDRRRRDNRVVNHWSVLEIGPWRIMCRDVFAMYDLVLAVRRAGTPVAMSEHEVLKARSVGEQLRTRQRDVTIDGLVAAFAQRPSDFEPFCADLFRAVGYRAQVTAATNDGGVDLRLQRDGRTTIVECKCYGRSHTVGRPVLQKLHGANAVEHADAMMVVTTSTFTSGAVEFARQTGIELVDGDRLISMVRQAWGHVLPPEVCPATDVTLTRQELLTGFPPDMRVR